MPRSRLARLSPVPEAVLYLAIPAHNEVATIGVLLWRLRTVLAEFPREYEVVVYDDASTDDTATVAEQYERAMPVTVIRGTTRLGYAGATDALLRHVAGMTRYPRRDAVLLLQGDFTDPPGIIPEFARRFDGGADLVVGERLAVADAPTPVRRLFKSGQWVMRPFVRVDGVRDLTASMRLVRISALRDAMRAAGDAPLLDGDSWTANADLLLRLVPHARRVEAVPMEPTFGVRMRETRRVAFRDAMALLTWSWRSRGRRAVAGSSSSEGHGESERRPGRQGRRSERGERPAERRQEPELNIERLRERVRESGSQRDDEGSREERGRRGRDPRRERGGRGEGRGEGRGDGRGERPDRQERPIRSDRPERQERPARPERSNRSERPERPPRPPRAERPEPAPRLDPTVELDDPFAPPAGAAPAGAAPAAAATPRREPIDATLPPPVWTPAPELLANDGPTNESLEPETDDGADEGGDESADADGTGRPRRRNRRSRRGRRRRSGEGSAAEESTAEGSAADQGGESIAGASGAGDAGDDHRNGDRNVVGDEATTDEGGDGSAEGDGDDDPSRPRRRGRRGRRGGTRRSRGRRDREQSEASDPFAPPPPPIDPFA